MLDKTDLKILSYLRSNARQSLALIAKKIGIPSSTLFDKVKRYEKRFVHKHTTLLDFDKLGFSTKVQVVLKAPLEKKHKLQEFLLKHKNVNTLYKINHGFDFLIECFFKNQSEAKSFIEHLQRDYGINKIKYFDVLEELKKEEFLSRQDDCYSI